MTRKLAAKQSLLQVPPLACFSCDVVCTNPHNVGIRCPALHAVLYVGISSCTAWLQSVWENNAFI